MLISLFPGFYTCQVVQGFSINSMMYLSVWESALDFISHSPRHHVISNHRRFCWCNVLTTHQGTVLCRIIVEDIGSSSIVPASVQVGLGICSIYIYIYLRKFSCKKTLQGGPLLVFKWSYYPCKWPYRWVTGAIRGNITLLKIGRGPHCTPPEN